MIRSLATKPSLASSLKGNPSTLIEASNRLLRIMKTKLLCGFSLVAVAIGSILSAVAQISPQSQQPTPIQLDQLGAVAGKQYEGDGLSVTATPDGARLHCAFQRLE